MGADAISLEIVLNGDYGDTEIIACLLDRYDMERESWVKKNGFIKRTIVIPNMFRIDNRLKLLCCSESDHRLYLEFGIGDYDNGIKLAFDICLYLNSIFDIGLRLTKNTIVPGNITFQTFYEVITTSRQPKIDAYLKKYSNR